jgi:hypothetical protein
MRVIIRAFGEPRSLNPLAIEVNDAFETARAYLESGKGVEIWPEAKGRKLNDSLLRKSPAPVEKRPDWVTDEEWDSPACPRAGRHLFKPGMKGHYEDTDICLRCGKSYGRVRKARKTVRGQQR